MRDGECCTERMYLQFGTRWYTSLYGPVNDLHSLEKLIVMLLGRDDLDAQWRVQVHAAVDRFLIPCEP